MKKSPNRRFNKSRSALRRFMLAAIDTVMEHDPEAVLMFRNIWPKQMFSVRRQEIYMTSRMNSDAPGCREMSQEFRLNNAGFKLWLSTDYYTGALQAYVGGDQAMLHPEAYVILTMLLQKEGLLPKDRMNQSDPMTGDWFVQNMPKLQPWARQWVKDNFHLATGALGIIYAYGQGDFIL